MVLNCDIQKALTQDKYNSNADPDEIITIPIEKGETSKSVKIVRSQGEISRGVDVIDEIIVDEPVKDLVATITDQNDTVLYELPVVNSKAN